MKTLNLNTYGVQEMNAVEMQQVDGGIIPVAIMIGVWAVQATICAGLLGAYATIKVAEANK